MDMVNVAFRPMTLNYPDDAAQHKHGARLTDLIEYCYYYNHRVSILDFGGDVSSWLSLGREYLTRHCAEVTIVKQTSTSYKAAGSVEIKGVFRFRFAVADACDLSAFADKQFDIACSNGVIEHLGDLHRMWDFSAEMQRVGVHNYHQVRGLKKADVAKLFLISKSIGKTGGNQGHILRSANQQ